MKKKAPVILSIIGKSDSGKTTLILKLLPELKNGGYKVAVAKHCPCGFDLDVKGKDSYRFSQAGASGTFLSSGDKVAVIRPKEDLMTLKEKLQDWFMDFDFVLMEGYNDELGVQKIQIIRKGIGGDIISSDEVIGYVSDMALDVKKPIYGPDDILGIMSFVGTLKTK